MEANDIKKMKDRILEVRNNSERISSELNELWYELDSALAHISNQNKFISSEITIDGKTAYFKVKD